MQLKKIIWHPKAIKEIKGFSTEVRDKLGYLLFRLQKNEVLSAPHVKSMKTIGQGVKELRVKSSDGIYRTFYVLLENNSISVFYAFKKKSQKTPAKDKELAKKNLKEIMLWQNLK